MCSGTGTCAVALLTSRNCRPPCDGGAFAEDQQRRLNFPSKAFKSPSKAMAKRRLENFRNSICSSIDKILAENRESLASDLAASFKRSRTTESPTARPSRRKRRPKETFFPIRLTCLGSPDTKVTSSKLTSTLTAIGLGNSHDEQFRVPLSWNKEKFRDFIETKFPQLRGEEYELMRTGTNHRLEALPSDAFCPKDIKACDMLNRSAIYIRPTRDILSKCKQVEHTDQVEHRDGQDEGEIIASTAVNTIMEDFSNAGPAPAIRIMCNVCYSTRTGGDFCLICSENEEFNTSLMQDRRKSLSRSTQVSDLPSGSGYVSDAHSKSVSELTKLRQQRHLDVRPEPADGFVLRFRLPNGTSCDRRFNSQQPLKDVINFIGCQEDATANFKFILPDRQVVSTVTPNSLRLRSLGIARSWSYLWIGRNRRNYTTIQKTTIFGMALIATA